MYLTGNSSREEILKFLEKDPFYFLYYFSDKPWAQPYIDEAAKEVAKLDPEYFLEEWANRFPQGIDLALFALKNENKYKIFANIFYV